MPRKSEPNVRIDEITDAEVSTAIRYLVPHAVAATRHPVRKRNDTAALLGVWLLVLMFYILAFSCMHHWGR